MPGAWRTGRRRRTVPSRALAPHHSPDHAAQVPSMPAPAWAWTLHPTAHELPVSPSPSVRHGRGISELPGTPPPGVRVWSPTPPGVLIKTRSPCFPGVEQSFDVLNSIKGTCKISRTFCAELAPRVTPQSHVNSLHIRKMQMLSRPDQIQLLFEF